MAKAGEEELDYYESDPEEEKRALGLRRREVASDDEEADGELDDRRPALPIHSDDESDDQPGAADYEEEEVDEEEDAYDAVEEVDEGEKETDGLHRRKGSTAGEVVEEGVADREVGGDCVDQDEEEEGKKENEPFAVPTAGAFYMHDDRFRGKAAGRSRQTNDGRKLWESRDDKKWGHDKFEEMSVQERHHDQGRRTPRVNYRGGRGGENHGPDQGYGRRNRSGAFSNGDSQSSAPKSVRGRGPRKYERNWKNSSQAHSLQNMKPAEKTSHGGSEGAATVISNQESDHVVAARKHSSLNSASPPFYPSAPSSKDVTLAQKNDLQTGGGSRNVRNAVVEEGFNMQQTVPLIPGNAVSNTAGIDKHYINNVQMRTAALSMGNSSQTRAQGRAAPVSGHMGYQPTTPHNQHNRISAAAQRHVVLPNVTQSHDQSSAQARNQQLSQRFDGGSQTSSPPNSAMSENSYEHVEAESNSESSKSRIALVGKGKGSGQGSFLYGGAQTVRTSGDTGVGLNDQNFSAAPTFLPVMQFGGQHPGGVGVPAVGMAFPGYVSPSQLGLGDSEMTWLPLLTGATGALGATYCSPYMAVDGSYHTRSSGQTSSMSSLSKETNITKSNNERPEVVGDENGQRQKPRRYSEMDFKQSNTNT